nr:MAG TPA: hypothetical protein [Caudoviricetes sp.]
MGRGFGGFMGGGFAVACGGEKSPEGDGLHACRRGVTFL